MSKLSILCIILFCLLSFTASAAKIYKWVGQDGQVHYSSTPPPEADAESTGMQTSRPKPEKEPDNKDDDSSLSQEERIKKLEEKIKLLENSDVDAEKLQETDKSGGDDKVAGSDIDSTAEEDQKPDFSVQGQMKMIEEAKRREAMMTRCRAKAPHGIDCNKPENYKNY